MSDCSNIYMELNKIATHEHGCIVYETEEEWQEVIIPYIVQGLRNGEKCVYVLNQRSENYLCECLEAEGINVTEAVSSGQLLIIQTADVFGGNMPNNNDQIIKIYTEWLDSFLQEGYGVIRISSEELFRVFNYELDMFLELQIRLNLEIFARYPLISLCQYHRRNEHPLILRDAIISCQWLVRNCRINRNPFCISPEFYYQHEDLAWEAEFWLQTQEALMESEEKYRLIVEHSLDLITIINAETLQILFVGPSQYFVLGYNPDEVIGQSCIDFIHPLQQEHFIAVFQEGYMKGEGEGVYPIKRKDGSYIWLESKGTVIRRKGYSDEIILFSRDIHEKKIAEEALRESQQKYKNQVDYLNTLINTMNELCITYDKNTILTFVNQRMLEALGYSLEEMIGKSILDFVPEDNIAAVRSQINKRLQGEVSSHENALIRKDGSMLLVRLKGSPIIENEEVIGGLVLAEDITQQRKFEREMARLVQLNTVGEIAASIGHEIRNPMTTVQGFLQIMSQNEDFKDHRDHFDLMLEELDRANSIISEFLALAKDKLVDLQCYNLNKIIETLAPLLIADAMNGDKNIRFELGNIPNLLLDEKEIRQLILNLVRNGLEAMDQGGTVTIKTCWEGDKVLLLVKDEGEGIPGEILEKLGTPFLSTKEKGTGLGLAVCYSIVTRHHGKITVNTSSGGSTFIIHFSSPA